MSNLYLADHPGKRVVYKPASGPYEGWTMFFDMYEAGWAEVVLAELARLVEKAGEKQEKK